MRVLICGDRRWTDAGAIKYRLMALMKKNALKPTDLVVIEGGAPGADTLAKVVAQELGVPVMEFPANWDFYHKAAGPIRNGWMLRWGMPDIVLAFHPFIENSRGTKDMVKQTKARDIPYEVYAS